MRMVGQCSSSEASMFQWWGRLESLTPGKYAMMDGKGENPSANGVECV